MKIRIVKILVLNVLVTFVVPSGFSATMHAYDDAYNPTTMRGTSGLSYNSNNQRSATGYTYDGNGNPTTYKSDSAWYDNANRLTAYEPYHTGTNSYFNVGYSYCGDGLMGQREKYVYVYSGNTWVSVDSQPTHIYNLDGHPVYETNGETESIILELS